MLVIALGLGVGALFVRSLTLLFVRERALQRYVYLKNGAHWAIAALAVVLLVSIEREVPEWLAAAIGGTAMAPAFVSSVVHRRHEPSDGDAARA